MVSMPTSLRSHGWTRAELAELPEDGLRYEIIDGELFVSAAPSWRHQVILGNLHLVMRAACPPELQVIFAPFAVGLADDTELQPDLLVAARRSFTERDLPEAPLLAVEVLSPSTRRADLVRKHQRLERAGCPSYWVVDPQDPSVTVWQLDGGRYVERAVVGADDTWTASLPYPVTIRPSDLLD